MTDGLKMYPILKSLILRTHFESAVLMILKVLSGFKYVNLLHIHYSVIAVIVRVRSEIFNRLITSFPSLNLLRTTSRVESG